MFKSENTFSAQISLCIILFSKVYKVLSIIVQGSFYPVVYLLFSYTVQLFPYDASFALSVLIWCISFNHHTSVEALVSLQIE